MHWDTKMADDDDDTDLNAFFEAELEATPAATDAFLRRIEADAIERLIENAEGQRIQTPVRKRGWLEALGGWPVGAGLASVAAAGLVIGIVLPEEAMSFDTFGLLSADGDLDAFDPGYGTELFEES
jgi:ferric-dicitrate binding protein FerR (iron transport regulator)